MSRLRFVVGSQIKIDIQHQKGYSPHPVYPLFFIN